MKTEFKNLSLATDRIYCSLKMYIQTEETKFLRSLLGDNLEFINTLLCQKYAYGSVYHSKYGNLIKSTLPYSMTEKELYLLFHTSLIQIVDEIVSLTNHTTLKASLEEMGIHPITTDHSYCFEVLNKAFNNMVKKEVRVLNKPNTSKCEGYKEALKISTTKNILDFYTLYTSKITNPFITVAFNMYNLSCNYVKKYPYNIDSLEQTELDNITKRRLLFKFDMIEFEYQNIKGYLTKRINWIQRTSNPITGVKETIDFYQLTKDYTEIEVLSIYCQVLKDLMVGNKYNKQLAKFLDSY